MTTSVPDDAAEASALLAGDAGARAMMGGTDLIVHLRAGRQAQRVVDLKYLPGMREIRTAEGGGVLVGAACTMNQVARDPLIRQGYAVLAESCEAVASYQLRNRATLGGNCCNASPAADTAPALYCVEAEVVVFGGAGQRRLRVDEFFAGPSRNALASGEFLEAIWLPPAPSAGSAGRYRKLGRTRMGDIAVANVAVYGWPADTQSGTAWRIALGAVGPTPLRARDAEAALAEDISVEGLQRASDLAAEAARPIDDVRATGEYRRAMIAVLVRRCLEETLPEMRVHAR